jgi:hypothetical protein
MIVSELMSCCVRKFGAYLGLRIGAESSERQQKQR